MIILWRSAAYGRRVVWFNFHSLDAGVQAVPPPIDPPIYDVAYYRRYLNDISLEGTNG